MNTSIVLSFLKRFHTPTMTVASASCLLTVPKPSNFTPTPTGKVGRFVNGLATDGGWLLENEISSVRRATVNLSFLPTHRDHPVTIPIYNQ